MRMERATTTYRSGDGVREDEDGESSEKFSQVGETDENLRVGGVEQNSSSEGGGDGRFEESMEVEGHGAAIESDRQ